MVGGVGEDMALEGEFPKDMEHLVAPAGVVVALHVEDGVDESAYVLDGDGLGVEVDDGGGLVRQESILERLGRATVNTGADRGGSIILWLDSGIGHFPVASGSGERVMGVGGRSLLLDLLGMLMSGVPGSRLLVEMLLGLAPASRAATAACAAATSISTTEGAVGREPGMAVGRKAQPGARGVGGAATRARGVRSHLERAEEKPRQLLP